MKTVQFNPGDPVRFDHPNGSIGRVTCLRSDGPFRDDPAVYVTWHYGRDAFGDPVTATSVFYADQKMNLLPATEESLKAAMDREFNSQRLT